jgi:branched-chain amino acid transport system permease protein
LITTLWSGLTLGAVYAVVALQFDLVFGATGIFNFGQSGFIVLSSFFVYDLLGRHGWPVILVIPIITVATALLAVLQEQLTVRPLLRRRGGRAIESQLVTTLGAASVMEGIALLIWGSQPLAVPFFGSNRPLHALGGVVLPNELTMMATALVITGLAMFLLRHTTVGLMALATSENRSAAMLRGVNTRWVSMTSFAVAGAIAGVTAAILAPLTFASYDLGQSLVVSAFAALAIGGFGTPLGALLGGLIIGVLETFSDYLLDPNAGEIVVLGALLLALLLRPRGILGSRMARAI